MAILEVGVSARTKTHVDTPELLDRIKCNNFLEKIVPVVALVQVSMWAMTMLKGWQVSPSHSVA